MLVKNVDDSIFVKYQVTHKVQCVTTEILKTPKSAYANSVYQAPSFSANTRALDVMHADTYIKTSITWLWRCECYQSLQPNYYKIHATPTQACCPRMESLKNFSSYVYMYQSRP